jgi:L-histidine N-alpha-methyltransferase
VNGRTAPRRRQAFAADTAGRFSLERVFDPLRDSTLADDVRRGLRARRKQLPPKHFYDEAGSLLFDRICELPEYYLTRSEELLLQRSAAEIVALVRPTDLVELGSGAARKTTLLLDAAEALGLAPRYHPLDVCEPMLRASAEGLIARYPWLEVRAVVADYERHLDALPDGERRLVAFLGSTVGNFVPKRAAEFLGEIAARLRPGEHLLLGADLVKEVAVLEAAYDDEAGVTAEFNRNVLKVINRELGGDFDPAAFDHVAFFHRRKRQIEMHLRARHPQRVTLASLGMTVPFAAGETVHTEVSRKFRRQDLEGLCRRAGFMPRRWFSLDQPAFALLLCERALGVTRAARGARSAPSCATRRGRSRSRLRPARRTYT